MERSGLADAHDAPCEKAWQKDSGTLSRNASPSDSVEYRYPIPSSDANVVQVLESDEEH